MTRAPSPWRWGSLILNRLHLVHRCHDQIHLTLVEFWVLRLPTQLASENAWMIPHPFQMGSAVQAYSTHRRGASRCAPLAPHRPHVASPPTATLPSQRHANLVGRCPRSCSAQTLVLNLVAFSTVVIIIVSLLSASSPARFVDPSPNRPWSALVCPTLAQGTAGVAITCRDVPPCLVEEPVRMAVIAVVNGSRKVHLLQRLTLSPLLVAANFTLNVWLMSHEFCHLAKCLADPTRSHPGGPTQRRPNSGDRSGKEETVPVGNPNFCTVSTHLRCQCCAASSVPHVALVSLPHSSCSYHDPRPAIARTHHVWHLCRSTLA